MVALPFRTAKEAQNIGNNTNYGLAASVWSDNLPTGKTSQIFMIKSNSYFFNPEGYLLVPMFNFGAC